METPTRRTKIRYPLIIVSALLLLVVAVHRQSGVFSGDLAKGTLIDLAIESEDSEQLKVGEAKHFTAKALYSSGVSEPVNAAWSIVEGKADLLDKQCPNISLCTVVPWTKQIKVQIAYQGKTTWAVFDVQPIFTDALPAWAEKEINALAHQGVISGFSDGTFGASLPMSQGQMVASLYQLLKDSSLPVTDLTKCTIGYADVPPLHYAYEAFCRFQVNGMNVPKGTGWTPTNYGVGYATKRSTAATYVSWAVAKNIAQALGVTVDPLSLPFTDVPPTNAPLKEAIATVNALGIMTGMSDGTFKPDLPVSRADAAVILFKTLEKKQAANLGSVALSSSSSSSKGPICTATPECKSLLTTAQYAMVSAPKNGTYYIADTPACGVSNGIYFCPKNLVDSEYIFSNVAKAMVYDLGIAFEAPNPAVSNTPMVWYYQEANGISFPIWDSKNCSLTSTSGTVITYTCKGVKKTYDPLEQWELKTLKEGTYTPDPYGPADIACTTTPDCEELQYISTYVMSNTQKNGQYFVAKDPINEPKTTLFFCPMNLKCSKRIPRPGIEKAIPFSLGVALEAPNPLTGKHQLWYYQEASDLTLPIPSNTEKCSLSEEGTSGTVIAFVCEGGVKKLFDVLTYKVTELPASTSSSSSVLPASQSSSSSEASVTPRTNASSADTSPPLMRGVPSREPLPSGTATSSSAPAAREPTPSRTSSSAAAEPARR